LAQHLARPIPSCDAKGLLHGLKRMTKEQRRAAMRAYYRANRAAYSAYQSAYKTNRKATDPEYRERVQANHRRETRDPKKDACRSATKRAIRDGKLTRPTACERCGKPCRPEAHHPSYDRPLEIKWLCKACHTAEHHDGFSSEHELTLPGGAA